MKDTLEPRSNARRRPRTLLYIGWALACLVVAAAALDTTVVRIGSKQDTRVDAFSAEAFGKKTFPLIQAAVVKDAVDAPALAAAIAADKAAAGEKLGRPGSVGPIFPVHFSGVVGQGRSGIFTIAVDGLPAGLKVRLQTGPAINGTDVRDATGMVTFEQFTNQIEYQDAGSALNDEIKVRVLGGINRDKLSGRQVDVVGVFQLVNPSGWLVTPVRMSVK